MYQDYTPQEAELLWKKTQTTYLKFVGSMPYTGAKKNRQATSIYDTVALFAYYEAVPKKPTLEEFYAINKRTFVLNVKNNKSLFNLNWKWVETLEYAIFKMIEKSIGNRAHDGRWGNTWKLKVAPRKSTVGVKYVFEDCPIVDFAKKHGFMHLMPAVCNCDYPALEAMRGGLIRNHTVAMGYDTCDYWLVGSKSPHLQQYPRKENEEGYWYNPLE